MGCDILAPQQFADLEGVVEPRPRILDIAEMVAAALVEPAAASTTRTSTEAPEEVPA